MMLLPADWVETKVRPLRMALLSSFWNLLKLMHDVALLSEVVISFNKLEGFLAIEHGLIKVWQKRITELEANLQLKEAAVRKTKEKLKSVEAWAKADKAKVIAEAKLKAVEEYKVSKEFKAEIIEGSSVAYWLPLLRKELKKSLSDASKRINPKIAFGPIQICHVAGHVLVKKSSFLLFFISHEAFIVGRKAGGDEEDGPFSRRILIQEGEEH
ncbi:hypothetical protein COCNU_11G005080 [Cocos nucifera]|uniref:Uncharacterized protein n=1 Tax=Cocos nucifera TaxID=13894 RepID=A0A8K0N8R9_COCNU|nr:hypothetical protein COCNU_11G005080 [Cocos nucifera]